MTKRICIISFSPIARDARVLRQIKYLGPRYDLAAIGYGDAHPAWRELSNVTWLPVIPSGERPISKLGGLVYPLLGKISARAYDTWFWRKPHRRHALDLALANRCDAYHANDWDALPIAGEAAARHGVPLIFDAHEYAPLEFGDRWAWRFLYSPAITYTLRKYAPRVAASTTVAQPIADRYAREFGLNMIAVLNAPEVQPVPSHEPDPDQIRLIHHGGAIRGRRLERMIEVIARCASRYTLHFMLTPSQPDYLDYLRAFAEQAAPGRVIFHDPVRPEQIVQEIAQYDAGFYLLEPDNYNNESALPNKLFDFICAGLAVCVGPSPEMARLVREHGCGVVAPSFDPADVAATLDALSPEEIHALRAGSARASKTLNAQVEMGKVVAIYDRLLAEGEAARTSIPGLESNTR
jgi:glycosyltransferase involved in cell wall biosynthesis